jgi:hypothetical protein
VQDRHQAVSATLRVSFELLSAEEYARYQELSLFPEDVAVPLATLQLLWGATGKLDDFDTEEVCRKLYRLSLLLEYDLVTRTIRLHDVVRTYLRHVVGMRLPALHAQLLDASRCQRWADLPSAEPYLWDHLAEHLLGANRSGALLSTVTDLRYLARKTLVRGASAVESDLLAAERCAPDDVPLRLLTRQFVNMEHLLNRCDTLNSVASTLLSRLQHLPELADLCQRFAHELPHPSLTSWHPLPDLPHPALIRTLAGHTSEVTGCAVSPDEAWIVSAFLDATLKVWDARTGACLLTFPVEGPLEACAFHPDGRHLVAGGVSGVYFLERVP